MGTLLVSPVISKATTNQGISNQPTQKDVIQSIIREETLNDETSLNAVDRVVLLLRKQKTGETQEDYIQAMLRESLTPEENASIAGIQLIKDSQKNRLIIKVSGYLGDIYTVQWHKEASDVVFSLSDEDVISWQIWDTNQTVYATDVNRQ